jgi:hypothetical protein
MHSNSIKKENKHSRGTIAWKSFLVFFYFTMLKHIVPCSRKKKRGKMLLNHKWESTE